MVLTHGSGEIPDRCPICDSEIAVELTPLGAVVCTSCWGTLHFPEGVSDETYPSQPAKCLAKLSGNSSNVKFLVLRDRRLMSLELATPRWIQNRDMRDRLRNECQRLKEVAHENVVQCYGLNRSRSGNHWFVVMEYVNGCTLRDCLYSVPFINVADVLYVLRTCAAALHHMSNAGCIHRNLGLDNILITRGGQLKIAEFITSHRDLDDSLTGTGSWMGNECLAPEQARDARLADPRSDIYSLGAIAYILLTKKLPFGGQSALELIFAKERGEIIPASTHTEHVPQSVDSLLARMMARNPDDRFEDGREVVRAIDRIGLANPRLSFLVP